MRNNSSEKSTRGTNKNFLDEPHQRMRYIPIKNSLPFLKLSGIIEVVVSDSQCDIVGKVNFNADIRRLYTDGRRFYLRKSAFDLCKSAFSKMFRHYQCKQTRTPCRRVLFGHGRADSRRRLNLENFSSAFRGVVTF